ncbi:DnaJ domain protein [Rickettsiales bacterium Ac37b]|nr:DnaJ domain protein [Rickettsiales bacterium Ac37b]
MKNNIYKILGISKDTPPEEISKQYKKQLLFMHPDKGGDLEKFKEFQRAYEDWKFSPELVQE